MRASKSALWRVLLFIAVLLPAAPIRAASHYAEDFSSGQANGWTSSTPWSAATHDYRNSVDNLDAVIAVYGGDTWTTDYTYNLRMLSQYGGDPSKYGNRVGVVFNYVDDQTYYRLLINTLGEVRLEKVTNGVGVVVNGGIGTVADVNSDIWLNVQLVLRGNLVTARVQGHQAFANVAVTGLTATRIGVISQYNLGQFDNIEIIPSATALFRTGFDGASIGAPYECAPNTCFQPISGTDPVTGFSWPVTIWTMTGRFQTTTGDNFNPPLSNSILNEIVTMAGPQGNQTSLLHQSIKIPRSSDTTKPFPQDPYYITEPTSNTVTQGDLYIRYWVKLQSSAGGSGLGNWRTLLQWKTGGDFRVNLSSATYGFTGSTACPSGSTQYWRVYADNVANSTDPNWQQQDYWEKCNQAPTVTTGQWTKIEFFSHRGTPGRTDGRVWVAINGQQVFDERGRKMWGDQSLRINRIMAPQIYTNASAAPGAPIEQWVDDYEVWDGFPADASPH